MASLSGYLLWIRFFTIHLNADWCDMSEFTCSQLLFRNLRSSQFSFPLSLICPFICTFPDWFTSCYHFLYLLIPFQPLPLSSSLPSIFSSSYLWLSRYFKSCSWIGIYFLISTIISYEWLSSSFFPLQFALFTTYLFASCWFPCKLLTLQSSRDGGRGLGEERRAKRRFGIGCIYFYHRTYIFFEINFSGISGIYGLDE